MDHLLQDLIDGEVSHFIWTRASVRHVRSLMEGEDEDDSHDALRVTSLSLCHCEFVGNSFAFLMKVLSRHSDIHSLRLETTSLTFEHCRALGKYFGQGGLDYLSLDFSNIVVASILHAVVPVASETLQISLGYGSLAMYANVCRSLDMYMMTEGVRPSNVSMACTPDHYGALVEFVDSVVNVDTLTTLAISLRECLYGAGALAQMVSAADNLRDLTIGFLDADEENASGDLDYLCYELMNNTNIERLKFDRLSGSSEFFDDFLVPVLYENTTIRILHLSFLNEDQESMKAFLDGLPEMTGLVCLKAPYSPDLAAEWLCAIQNNDSLEHLSFHFRRQLTQEELMQVAEMILWVDMRLINGQRMDMTRIRRLLNPLHTDGPCYDVQYAQFMFHALMDHYLDETSDSTD